jgi:transcriptional regulator with XRE-family HTH domain
VEHRQVQLEERLTSLIERGGYSRNRKPILDAVEITAAALSQYTNGKTRPSFQKLVGLADFFGVSLDYLVYGEPVSAPVDNGPLARYVEHALSDVQTRVTRHSDVVTRIGRVLADRIDDVAKELMESRTAGREGLIEQDEVVRVERYCLRADIVTTDLSPNIIDTADGNRFAGQFFQVVTTNISKGCRYRFLVADVPADAVTNFRQMVGEAVGGDRLNEYCTFRRSIVPVMGGAGLYRLDTTTLEMEEPGLFTQFSKHLSGGDCLGYVNRPNSDSNADMLMSPEYTERACGAFEALWTAAGTRVA